MAERSPIRNRLRRLAPPAIVAAGLAVLAVVHRGELAGWIAGDRDATAAGDPAVAFYTCPMDPSVESDHPAACPICGMALTPVSSEDRASGAVRLSTDARIRLGVVVAPVETRPLIKRVVAAGEVTARVPGGERAAIVVRAYRGDAREVAPGQPVEVSVATLPLTRFVGTVAPPRATAARGELRLVVDDPGRALHPGMRVEAQLEVVLSPRLVVPAEAVAYAGPRRIVFVEHGSGRFEPRTPKLGITAAGLVEVLDGLAAGDSVVVEGTFLLAAENRLRSDGSLWGELARPVAVQRAAPGAGSDTPPRDGRP